MIASPATPWSKLGCLCVQWVCLFLYLLGLFSISAQAQSFPKPVVTLRPAVIYGISGKPELSMVLTNFRTHSGKLYPGKAIHDWQVFGPEGSPPMTWVGSAPDAFVWMVTSYRPGTYELEGFIEQHPISVKTALAPVSNIAPLVRSIWVKPSGSIRKAIEVKVEHPPGAGICSAQLFSGTGPRLAKAKHSPKCQFSFEVPAPYRLDWLYLEIYVFNVPSFVAPVNHPNQPVQGRMFQSFMFKQHQLKPGQWSEVTYRGK